MKTVLFLCTGNYYRSRFAEELFNHRAEHAGLDWIAQSRGLAIERGVNNVGPISPFALEGLKDRGQHMECRWELYGSGVRRHPRSAFRKRKYLSTNCASRAGSGPVHVGHLI